MKIAYVTNSSFWGGWAHAVQIVNMCKAFSNNGADVTLILPYRKIYSGVDLFEHYKIPKTFNVVLLPCIDLSVGSSSSFFFWVRFISFYISARFFVWVKSFDFIYSRDLYSYLFFPTVIIEQHSFPKKINFLLSLIFTKNRKIVSLTPFIKKKFVDNGILENNSIVAQSAVDLNEFKEGNTKINIDGIGDGDFVFGYIGTLKTMNMEKGVSDCLSALSLLDSSFKFLVVGGETIDIEYYKNIAKEKNVSDRVVFVGKVSYSEVSKYTSVCDIFVAPYPENEHYNFYMSPLKIFEYMASGKPIISTKLPTVLEVLQDGENSILVEPNNPKLLSEAILRLRNDKELGIKISKKALEEVSNKYTWDKRAQSILSFMKK